MQGGHWTQGHVYVPWAVLSVITVLLLQGGQWKLIAHGQEETGDSIGCCWWWCWYCVLVLRFDIVDVK